jgi:hypothetical protein
MDSDFEDDDGDKPTNGDSQSDKNGLELAFGPTPGHSRETTSAAKSANATPTLGAAKGNGRGRGGAATKRTRDDDDDEGEDDEVEQKPSKKPAVKKVSNNGDGPAYLTADDGDGADPDHDSTPYCICSQASYGEMIGCDNDECHIEWVSRLFSKYIES